MMMIYLATLSMKALRISSTDTQLEEMKLQSTNMKLILKEDYRVIAS